MIVQELENEISKVLEDIMKNTNIRWYTQKTRDGRVRINMNFELNDNIVLDNSNNTVVSVNDLLDRMIHDILKAQEQVKSNIDIWIESSK